MNREFAKLHGRDCMEGASESQKLEMGYTIWGHEVHYMFSFTIIYIQFLRLSALSCNRGEWIKGKRRTPCVMKDKGP